ncbi:MAG: PadR family transcriptional regulator [Anaerolineales bacterium]|nr:PadR family transcriptional regulator [Anaerolineales bacterium]
MLKYALLGLLQYNPSTGYDLKQFMDTSTSNFWHAKLSQIYITLKALEKEGLVTSDVQEQTSRPDRRVYTLTEQGTQELDKWLRDTNVELPQLKDPFLLKLFFCARLDKESLLVQLKLQRDLHQKLLNEYRTDTKATIQNVRENVPQLKKDALFWGLTLRSGELIEEATIRWLDEAIETINKEI